MSKKFKGKLGKPIVVPPPGLLELMASPDKAFTAHSAAIEDARTEKMRLLFDHYGVDQEISTRSQCRWRWTLFQASS